MSLPENEQRLAVETEHAPPDWPTIVSHAVDGLGRIVRAEIGLFELALRSGIEAQVTRAAMLMAALAAGILGAGFLLTALVLLIHLYCGVWWITFAVTGALCMLIALAAILWSRRIAGRLIIVTK